MASLIALTGPVAMTSCVGASREGGIAEVPRIIRAYCEAESLGSLSHNRFVVSSLIRFTDSDIGPAAQGNGVPRGRSQAGELVPCLADP